ncbi:MAG: hypothetical protein HFE63_00495 [Clostridiales bacterium]|nr:hypothetical protein [Clostridiales bacterium]
MQFVRSNIKILRRALIFIIISTLCVGISVCLCSEIGAVSAFKLGVRLNTVDVDTSDTAYLEYYSVRSYIPEVNSYRIFIDGSYTESYAAVLDFLKFVKQNTDIAVIRFSGGDTDAVNEYLLSGDISFLYSSGLDVYKQMFIRDIYTYNQTLPPQRRVGYIAGDDVSGAGEFVISERIYDRSEAIEGVLDVSCIYPDNEICDKLFNIDTEAIRFGTLEKLSWYTSYLNSVSGNFGYPEFTGINQPEFYFIISRIEEEDES